MVFLLLVSGTMYSPLIAQAPPKAKVFKENKAPTLNLIRRSDDSYELWEEFVLMQKANSGDANAQHELGIRYLIGRGFGLDTADGGRYVPGR